MKEIFEYFFNNKTEYVTKEQLEKNINISLIAYKLELDKYFDYDIIKGYKLKPSFSLGILDVKKTVAFLLQENKDLIIEKRDLKNAMNKDLVLVKKGLKFNIVELIITHHLKNLVVFVKANKKGLMFLTKEKYYQNIVVKDYPPRLVTGQIIFCEVKKITENNIVLEYKKILGHINDPGIDILQVVYNYNWPLEFTHEQLTQAQKIIVNYQKEKENRIDLTDALTVTIDSEDAKDLDDAISLTKTNETYVLGVHIADVSYFVKSGSPLDDEAYRRATSVYLADRVIPMLPHSLSNDLCSLNEKEEKLTLTCEITLSKTFDILSYRIIPSIIKTTRRLSYNQVNKLFKENISIGDQKIDDMLFLMNEISLHLKKIRKKRGSLEFSSTELKFIFDSNQRVIDIKERKTDDAEELIESFMLLANETVSYHFVTSKLPGIYRVHEKPDSVKMEKALDILYKLGFDVDYRKLSDPKKIQQYTKKALDSKYHYIVNSTLLRAMQKAKYLENPIGHFGLGAKYYSHFTSPIRRYPDLLLHRLIRDFVFKENNSKKNYFYYTKNLPSFAIHTSNQERKAISMERDTQKIKCCEYLENKIGQNFRAKIIQLMNSGMFIMLENGIEGFVSLKDLNGYFEYDENNLFFINKNKTKYQLGDDVMVQLLDVNLVDYQNNFTILEKR